MAMGRPTATLLRLFLFLWIGGLIGASLKPAPTPRGCAWAQENAETAHAYFYDPVGRRDPFLSPFHVAPEQDVVASSTTPLQRFDLGQLKLVGVIWEASRPKALIEDRDGLGYIVEAGTLIGANGGVIRTIEPERVVIEEYETDFSGERRTRQRALRLAVADASSAGGGTDTNR